MATYKYVAKDIYSKKIRGTMDAENRDDLVLKLRNEGLYLMDSKDVTKKVTNTYKLKYK